MKIPLLLVVAALALAGCCTNKENQGAAGTQTYTGTGTGASVGYVEYTKTGNDYGEAESEGYENEVASEEPRGFQTWRYGRNPDRIAPLLPLDPKFPPSETPVVPLPPD